jgi:hypothetical protein
MGYPAADTQLFSDCVAIDCALYHFRNREDVRYDARIVVAILLIVIHLTDLSRRATCRPARQPARIFFRSPSDRLSQKPDRSG